MKDSPTPSPVFLEAVLDGLEPSPSAPPTDLLLEGTALATDGGSIAISAMGDGRQRRVFLDQSIDSCRRGAIQLYVDGHAIRRGSETESRWLELLASAHADSADVADSLVSSLIETVRSKEYQSSRGAGPAGPPADPLAAIRELVFNGKRAEAVRAYRALQPSTSLADAIAAVDRLLR